MHIYIDGFKPYPPSTLQMCVSSREGSGEAAFDARIYASAQTSTSNPAGQ